MMLCGCLLSRGVIFFYLSSKNLLLSFLSLLLIFCLLSLPLSALSFSSSLHKISTAEKIKHGS